MKTVEELEEEKKLVSKEIVDVESKIAKLKRRLNELQEKKDSLNECIAKVQSDAISSKDWSGTNYEWSQDVNNVLATVFKIKSFRPKQLSAINSTLSGVHALVVMPTGAGKSLCYQLPAMIKPGFTLVVSPLVSLMEDQIRSLEKKNIPAKLMTSTMTREETNNTLCDIQNEKTKLKLVYVTPERLAKSKRFMACLQKCYKVGRLQRIAIDEVHCCSQWGHDFRPDYKFLGVLRCTFPNVPVLGLTATATSHVLKDVQKMLNIPESLIIKTTFNRPNLFYHILEKPSSQDECLTILESLLKERYKGESGIIYTYSIKDAEDITDGLRKRGLRVACYHASMEAESKSNVHNKWHDDKYQAIVATVAFGMGIDKPDVKFVIHHTMSKSMESYYQESGRAGRDGRRAECVTLYRMQDIFKISAMVFSSVGSKEHLYGMIKYCLSGNICRRKIIAEYFNEDWGETDCNEMCDNCRNTGGFVRKIDVVPHCKTLNIILKNPKKAQTKLTAQKLLDAWYLKGPVALRHESSKPNIARNVAEDVIAYLLIEGYLEEDFHFTAYTTCVYLKEGPNMHFINDPDLKLTMDVRKYFNINNSAQANNDAESDHSKAKADLTLSIKVDDEPVSKKLKV